MEEVASVPCRGLNTSKRNISDFLQRATKQSNEIWRSTRVAVDDQVDMSPSRFVGKRSTYTLLSLAASLLDTTVRNHSELVERLMVFGGGWPP